MNATPTEHSRITVDGTTVTVQLAGKPCTYAATDVELRPADQLAAEFGHNGAWLVVTRDGAEQRYPFRPDHGPHLTELLTFTVPTNPFLPRLSDNTRWSIVTSRFKDTLDQVAAVCPDDPVVQELLRTREEIRRDPAAAWARTLQLFDEVLRGTGEDTPPPGR